MTLSPHDGVVRRESKVDGIAALLLALTIDSSLSPLLIKKDIDLSPAFPYWNIVFVA
jgi:hypothetical protein